MRVALYLRRSTEEHQAASLETQRASANLFAAEKGWTVVATFEDSGVSGSEFVERPGLRGLKACAAKGACDAVLVRALDRIGRDTLRAVEFVRDLAEMGVKVWCYSTGTELKVEDPVSILSAVAVSLAGDIERRALVGRITEGLKRRAERGLCVGGDCYGYLRVRTPEGVRYAPHPEESKVVVELFERRAKGESFAALAHDLNARGVPSPKAGRRGTGSWDLSAVQTILKRDRYRGVLVWGRRGSTYRGGTRVEIERPESECTVTVRPEFALVDEALWQAVRAQDQARTGRGKGAKPTHFLSTLARCTCGGPLHVTRMRWGTGATAVDVPAYACGWAHRRGKAVCANKLRRPVEELDACVLGWVRDELLAPTAVDAILRDLRAALQAPAPVADEVRAQKVAALGRVEAEVARLTRAIATTDDAPEALVRALADAEKRLRALRAEVARHAPHAPTQAEDWPSIEAAVRLRLDALRATFDRQREGARETLRAILRGPIVCRPVVVEGLRGRRYHLTADAALPGFDLMPGVDSVPPITPVASLEGYRGCDRLLVNSPPPKNAKLSRIAGIPRVA